MIVNLMQQDKTIDMYVDGEKVTSFPNQTANDVIKWVRKNISNTEIHTGGVKTNG